MMNRGVLQNSPVQQMMATGNNPNWWNINNLMRPPLISSPSSSSSTSNFLAPLPNHNGVNHHNDDDNNVFHHAHQFNTMSMPTPATSSSWLDHNHSSWIQLLLGGVFMGDEGKKMEANNWEEQQIVLQQQAAHHHHHHHHLVDVKQENSVNSYNNNNNNNNVYDQEFQLKAANCWSHHLPRLNIPVSSPQSCVTSYSTSGGNNLLEFSSSISSDHDNNLHSIHPPPPPDRTSECNSTSTGGGVAKKAKVQPPSTQSSNNTTFKVRKEKLGDRITALHQLVSPFGKTDTASVLLEAIGYIRFLQSQIEALSLPYLNSGAGNKKQPQPQALVNDNGLKRKGGPDHQDSFEEQKDLRSRGLCLVPLSCTMHVGSDNGADYWAPPALVGGFR